MIKEGELTEEEVLWQWRTKKLIKQLEEARGNGTSMITLLIPPKKQISDINRLLTEEYGTASNIKSRVNRLSVLSAITAAQQKLKLYPNTPDNGLIIYSGTVALGGDKEKKLCLDIVPFKPINKFFYMCDSRFHTEDLSALFEDSKTFGFVIIDGHQCLWGTLSGSNRTVINKIQVDLPKKHGRGGQSAARFGRLRLEKRQNYLTKVSEFTNKFFISGDKATVSGIILAGLAEFKKELKKADLIDHRLKPLILGLVDISYGGEAGFHQAIELSAEILKNVKYMAEKELLNEFFEQIEVESGLYCFGVKDTMYALENGAVDRLVVWEELDIIRIEAQNSVSGEKKVLHLTPKQRGEPGFLGAEGEEWEVTKEETLLEWLTTHYKEFGCKIELITDHSTEGTQFCKGFGGVGGILRWKLEFHESDDFDSDIEDEDDFM